jgi:hypothetical protein
MKPVNLHRLHVAATLVPAVLFPFFINTLQAQERAHRPPPSPVASLPTTQTNSHPSSFVPTEPANLRTLAIDPSRMHYDAPGDGSLWARGRSYKASFDSSGATYFPAFGKRAPHDFPHALSPDAVTVGGASLPFERGATAVRDGDRVDIDRGAFTEEYELSPQAVEQSFVFNSLPRTGDLVVHIPVASELAAAETPDGLEFRGELGRVTYGRATAIDASGRRAAADTHLENGSIVMRVGADFLASATLPVVIDPIVGLLLWMDGPGTGVDAFNPDVAWDPTQGVWIAVYEQTFSATDTDVYAWTFTNSGAFLVSGYIDLTSAAWSKPRCADLAAAQQFLVVCEITSASPHMVMGRTVTPTGILLVTSPQFVIASDGVNAMVHPEVGGDPYPSLPSYYCVVYEEDSSSTQQIAVRLVAPDTTLVGSGPTYMPQAPPSPDFTPSVSKSDDSYEWLVAWVRSNSFLHDNIWAAHIRYDGSLADGPFEATGGVAFEASPAVSSPLHNTLRFAIAYASKTTFSGNYDIMVAALDGTNVLQVANLTAMENSGEQLVDHIEPAIDSDGRHFLVQYSEYSGIAAYNVYASDLYLSGAQLGLSESHVALELGGPVAFNLLDSRVSAAHDVNASSHRFLTAFDREVTPTDHDALAELFDVVEGGSVSPFCFGDGTGAACPCGNSGAPGQGCANSAQSGGAVLAASGTASTLNDSLVLQTSGMPGNATCIFLQGTTAVAAVPFGDGLRCVGGTLIRLGVKASSGGAASYPGSGDLPVSVRGAVPTNGGMRAYQVWYRDNNATFCTSATYNISSGVSVNWAW